MKNTIQFLFFPLLLSCFPKAEAQTIQRDSTLAIKTQANKDSSRKKLLPEVIVSGRKPLVEQKADRTVFNVENSISAIGGDALDALRKTPGVLIVNNQITIAGKGSVGIMLNGRLQQVSGEDLTQLLRSIPSDNLSKIEVITSPPAKYDAEGNSGLINLVTKKNMQRGLRGSATAGYNRNTYNSATASTSFNYNSGNVKIYANISAGDEASKYTNKGATHYPDQIWEQVINQGFFEKSVSLQAGADYTLSKNTTLGITYNGNTSRTKTDEHIVANVFDSGHHIDSSIITKAASREDFNRQHSLNLNYEWKIDTSGKKLTIDADYLDQGSQKARDFHVQHYLTDGSATGFASDNRTTTHPALTVKSIKSDVEWPFKTALLSFGAKAAFVNSDVDNLYEMQQGPVYVTDSSQTNIFSYTEQTQAVYLNLKKTLGTKWEFQAGLRGEHTHTTGYSPTTMQNHENDYTQLFPSAYIQYLPGEEQSITISYNRRINRPRYNLLNPFRFYYSLNSYFSGNPGLEPSFNNVVRLTYSLEPHYTFSAYTNHINNYWDRISNVDSTGETAGFTRDNLGNAWYYGASISVSFNPTPWWEFRGSINGEHSLFKLTHYNNESFSGTTGWIEAGNSFTLNKSKTLSAEINGYYHAPRQKDYKRWDEMSSIYFGLKALLLDKRLIVAVNVDDLFAKAFWYQTNAVNQTTEYSYDDEHSIRIAITYKFGNKNIKSRRERNTTSEEIQRATN